MYNMEREGWLAGRRSCESSNSYPHMMIAFEAGVKELKSYEVPLPAFHRIFAGYL